MSRIIPSHWGHQTKFRTEAQGLARRIFGELDPALDPRVLLLGLVMDSDRDLYPLFVDADRKDSLTNLFQEAARHAKAERARMYAEVEAQEGPEGVLARKRRIILEAWRLGVEAALTTDAGARDAAFFSSEPRRVDEFLICTVLQLDRRAMKQYFSLRKDAADEAAGRPASLIEATVQQYIRKCAVGLSEQNVGALEPDADWDHEEILRSAGRALADYPALGGRRDVTRRGLFHACNTISSLLHEGEAGRGTLILSHPDHAGLKVKVRFQRPVRLYDYSAARKMLETARPGFALLSDGAVIYGLGSIDLGHSVPGDALFQVNFLRHYTWELLYGARPLMRVSYGHPRLPRLPVLEARFRDLAARTFPALGPEALDRLWECARTASEQAHGTILVVREAAGEEAVRLKAQSAPVEGVELGSDALLAISSVDGAVLVDPSAVCHAFGVILDGRATARTDPSRGARYNSAVRYVQASECPCLAVVVSEDGGVDIVVREREAEAG